MTAELGHFALILAFCLALPQAFFGLAGARMRRPHWMALTTRAVAGQFVFTAFAFACLAYCVLSATISPCCTSRRTRTRSCRRSIASPPCGARTKARCCCGCWCSRSGPLAVAALQPQHAADDDEPRARRARPDQRRLRAVHSDDVESVRAPVAGRADGRDLNPLLQDPALAIHPPMLYIGYVGFSVPFAFAVAAMLEGKLDSLWARWVRPWTTVAWMFLTVGIALGSWWAYYELGWGGWWFWDPVENASFMPWLVGTALIHSLAVTEKRGLFKSWTLLLAITAFSLSLLGTFLVRSGVVESVHAFASDPAAACSSSRSW